MVHSESLYARKKIIKFEFEYFKGLNSYTSGLIVFEIIKPKLLLFSCRIFDGITFSQNDVMNLAYGEIRPLCNSILIRK